MRQEEWDSHNALVQIDAALSHIEGLLELSRSLVGTDDNRKIATNHFLGMDGLFVVEMGLKAIIACESDDGKVSTTHSTKCLYGRIKAVSTDAIKTIDAVWNGEGSFSAYMNFLDGKYNKWRYNFVAAGKKHDNIDLHAENMFRAIVTLRHVLHALISAKHQCESCGSGDIVDGPRAYCAKCGKRRVEYDEDAQSHYLERKRSEQDWGKMNLDFSE